MIKQLSHTFEDDSCLEEIDGVINYWAAYGMPDYVGGWEGFAIAYPTKMQLLTDKGVTWQPDTQKSS